MRHTISVLVENKFGVLARIAGLFSARGYNIASLSVSETLDPNISYMTIVVEAEDEKILEQIKKQLNKLIDILTVTDFTKKEHVDRELVIIKVGYSSKDKSKLENTLDKHNAKIIQHKDDVAIVEKVGNQEEIKGLLDDFKQFGIKELVRSGRIAMAEEVLNDKDLLR
jgi:acetolactate synthase-1/3 small subunit